VAAGDVMHPKNKEDLRKRVEHQVVFVGGAWHALGYKTGDKLIDSHDTPVGMIPGVLVHANYVEAVLDRRVVTPLSNRLVTAGECFIGFLLAIALSFKRLWLKALSAVVLIGLPVLLSVVAVQNFLVYFDVIVLDLVLLLKAAFEKNIEFYANHRRWLKYEAAQVLLASGTAHLLAKEPL
jgi:CHASE2 domain-containing sensor protein